MAPAVDGAVEPLLLDGAYRAIEGDPAHDLRVREVAPRAADLPDAFVGLPPTRLEVPEQLLLQGPRLVVLAQTVHPRLIERIQDLAVDVELQLAARGISDPNGTRSFVAVEPRELELRQPPFAGDAVHDL